MKRWLPALVVLCAGAAAVFYLARRSAPAPQQSETAPRVTAPEPSASRKPAAIALANTQTQVGTVIQRDDSPIPGPTPDPQSIAAPGASTVATAIEPVPTNAPPNASTNLAAPILLENMRTVLRQYGLRFGGNPVGNNAEITRALNGGNPKEVMFIPTDSGLRINEKGELVDSWGTPFFFHQLSAKETEVRSAGPDKVMYTEDDLVTK